MVNKKAQGMSTSTIILLILGLIILVILILGFSLGWNRLAPWINTNNIEAIKTSCLTACYVDSTYDFCTVNREVKDGVNDKFDATCQELAIGAEYTGRGYDIEECPNLCSSPATE